MTRRDEDAEIANIVREHGDATHRLACLQSKAERYAKTFRDVADALGRACRLKPAELVDDAHSAFMTDLLNTANAHISTPSKEEAQALISDIHKTVNVLTDTREKLRKFGI